MHSVRDVELQITEGLNPLKIPITPTFSYTPHHIRYDGFVGRWLLAVSFLGTNDIISCLMITGTNLVPVLENNWTGPTEGGREGLG